jgi:hypothetical protein
VGAALAACLCLTSAWSIGCEDDALRPEEVSQIDVILKTGATFEQDPYVRAETLRVLEVLADPKMVGYAKSAVSDEAPMVRVAAVRALLASGDADAGATLLTMYSKASEQERALLFESAQRYADEDTKASVVERALRSKDPRLRARAFSLGLLAEIDEAKEEGDDALIRQTLKPKLGRFVEGDDEELAAAALRRLIKLGEEDRAQRFIKQFEDDEAPIEARARASRVLWRAGARVAKPVFAEVLEPEEDNSDKLGLPIKQVDEGLVRAATLGAVALGDGAFVEQAQAYLNDASEAEYIEVLEALAASGTADAAVSVKIAMRDARPEVRQRAIELYGTLSAASSEALINAMNQEDARARKLIAKILLARFPAEWAQNLTFKLRSDADVDRALSLMRDVIEREDAEGIVEPLKERLLELSKGEKSERAAAAAYLLLLNASGTEELTEVLAKSEDVHTRYVYLEYLMRERPAESVPVFRRYFHDDLYALRLMSAAGLWRAFKTAGGGEGEVAAAEGVSEGEASEGDGAE